ncbi:uncharacterized protein LOC111466609 [Cucurbita maxima]|uniref:Uncharacterized protein LOC111466609 n=1 Tax=Cucurbita maxima TaxID=3661 RepID=A0A6J1HR43_CUCMA|nr:uncharacterized protein LOC111466609 [Cucurbita maxima]
MAQDFLVVCRLRRNNEFRQHSCSNRAASSQMNLSLLQAHSGEQVDFTSESNQKDVAEAAPVESSGDQKDYGSDDFYSDILKDDILNLDASAPYNAASDLFPLVFHRSDGERKYQQDWNDYLEWLPNQGCANRRIRLKWREAIGAKKLEAMQNGDSRYMVEKSRLASSELSQSQLMNTASLVSVVRGYARVVIFVLLILLALFVSIGGFWYVLGTLLIFLC